MTVVKRVRGLVCLVFLVMLCGFDFSKHGIPLEEIQPGGPPKDGIPALLHPKFIPGAEAKFLKEEDRVLALMQGNEAKAYPIRILNWHEVVNDTINGSPVLITYCPLCGTGMAFDPVIQGKKYTFGVSGLLYNSDVLLYDHQTESLWSQIQQEAVTGPLTGTRLPLLFLIHTTWSEWRKDHPTTRVLSTETGYVRDYSRDPYAGYAETSGTFFPIRKQNDRLPLKEWVLGVAIDGEAKAYPFSELIRQPSVFTDIIHGKSVKIHYQALSRTAYVTNLEGDPIPSIVGFWFAWYAFNPRTQIFTGGDNPPK